MKYSSREVPLPKGYYNNPEENAKAFTEDGFLRTGDAGYIDKEGNLFITERIKELMKTSNGKYIAPQQIEGKVGKDSFIEQIAIIADARKYVSALIVPNYDALAEYAKSLNLRYKKLCRADKEQSDSGVLSEEVTEPTARVGFLRTNKEIHPAYHSFFY